MKDLEVRFSARRKEYYEEYYESVRAAKSQVISVGDGFACHNDENRRLAQELINAFGVALDNDAKVIRLQYVATASITWLRMLENLKREHPRFSLHMQETDPVGLPSVICLVDREDKQRDLTMMLTQARSTDLKQREAGISFFFGSNNMLSTEVASKTESLLRGFLRNNELDLESLRDRIRTLTDERKKTVDTWLEEQDCALKYDLDSLPSVAGNINILDVDLVKQCMLNRLSQDDKLYFAYGSNIDRNRMQGRCKHSSETSVFQYPRCWGIGRLNGYIVTFNMHGVADEHADGGIANLEGKRDGHTLGILYAVSDNHLATLVTQEKKYGYAVHKLPIVIDDDTSVTAHVFVGPSGDEFLPPGTEYRQFIETGLDAEGFPEYYKGKLRHIMNGDNKTIVAFLCHSGREKSFARALKTTLETRSGGGIRCWLDEDGIRAGDVFLDVLQATIESADVFLTLVGNEGIVRWMNKELGLAYSLQIERKIRIVPVLIPGCASQPDLPGFLREHQWHDLRDGITETGIDRLVCDLTSHDN